MLVDVDSSSPVRSQAFDFPKESIINSWGIIYVGKNSKTQSFTDLDTKKIAVLQSNVYISGPQGILDYLKKFDVNAQLVTVPIQSDAFDLLNKGQVDAALVDRVFAFANQANYSNIKPTDLFFFPTTLTLAFQKGNSENAYFTGRIDYWMANLKSDHSSIYYQSLQNNGLGGLTVTKVTTPFWLLPAEIAAALILVILVAIIIRLFYKRALAIRKLKESEEKFHSLFDAMDEMVVLHQVVRDRNGKVVDYKILDCNPSFTSISGVPREKAIGSLTSKIYGSYELPYLDFFSKVLETGKPYVFEGYFKIIDKYLKVSVFSPSKEKLAVIASDISDRKKNEAVLERTNLQLKTIYNQTIDVLYDIAVEDGGKFRFSSVNDVFYKVTGLKQDQVIGKLVSQVIPEPSLTLVLSKYKEAIARKKGMYWEETTKYPKETKYGDVSVSPIFDKNGKCTNLIGTVHDITEREKIKQSLEESETLLRESQKVAMLGSYKLDVVSGRWVGSDILNRIFGIKNKYNRSVKGWLNLIHPDDQNMMSQYLKNHVIGEGKPFNKEYRIIRPSDHMVRWVHGLGKLKFNGGKHPVTMYGTIQDVTEEKNLHNQLVKSEDMFSRIFESSPYAVTITRIKDGKFISVNRAFSTLSGISRKEALSSSSVGLGVWANTGDRNRMMSELKTKGFLDSREFLFRTKTRGILSGLYSARTIDIGGKPCILSSIANISELKEAQEKVDQLERRNEATLSSIGDAVFSCDKDGKVLLFNKAAEQLTGIPANQAIGKKYNKIITFLKETDEKPVGDFLSEVLKQDKIIKNLNHTLLLSKAGVKIPVVNTISPIKTQEGNTVGGVVSFRDITRERQIDQAKTEFVSLASHQLRTPLTAINWYCEMLLAKDTGVLTSKQRNYMLETYKASKRMVGLMDSLLNVSRLEMGTFIIEPKPIDIIKLFKNAISELSSLITKRNIVLHEEYDPKVIKIPADSKLLTIVFQNLLSNAVKYSYPKGHVNLSVKKTKDSILIKILDNGIGIPENQQDKIFTKLFRADNVRQIDPDGTGLGLYIVKTIIDTCGGKVWFESKGGKGSIFYVSLPLSGMSKKSGSRQLI